jgi:hypothetical protein
MSHRATLHYSEALVRQTVVAFWRRSIGVGFVAAMVVVAIGVATLLVQGDKSWMVGTLATVLALCVSKHGFGNGQGFLGRSEGLFAGTDGGGCGLFVGTTSTITFFGRSGYR